MEPHEDTLRVRISYSPNKYEIGKVKELPAEQARLLIREGRATAHYDDEADGSRTEGETAVTVVPASQSSPARQARNTQTPAPTSQPAAATGVKHTSTSTPDLPPAA